MAGMVGITMKPESKQALANMASLAALAEELHESTAFAVPVGRPRDGITAREYAELKKISVNTARDRLYRLEVDGKYETVEAMAPNTYGTPRIMKQKFYRKVSNANKS